VVPAVCNMGERVVPTVRTLSEAAKRKRSASEKRGGLSQTTPRNKDARAQEHDKGSEAGGGRCRSRRVRVQLTESEVVVDVDDEF